MSNKIIKKAAACGLSAVMAFGLVAVTEAPKTANVSAATKKVKKLSFKKKGYVISAPGPVSYTHLDVYKRQDRRRNVQLL